MKVIRIITLILWACLLIFLFVPNPLGFLGIRYAMGEVGWYVLFYGFPLLLILSAVSIGGYLGMPGGIFTVISGTFGAVIFFSESPLFSKIFGNANLDGILIVIAWASIAFLILGVVFKIVQVIRDRE